jgi:hypothetical protein
MKKPLLVVEINGIVWYQSHLTRAELEAYLRRQRKPQPKTAQQIRARNTARSLQNKRKDSQADWTQPKWKTGGNPGLFVEGGKCSPR